MSTTHDQDAVAQAIDEMVHSNAPVYEVLAEIGCDFGDAVDVAQSIAAAVRGDTEPDTARKWALGCAMYGVALGIRAERVRQRRDGDHPSEVAPV